LNARERIEKRAEINALRDFPLDDTRENSEKIERY
jgi:hypothetical protein